jgi:hypothetical protein
MQLYTPQGLVGLSEVRWIGMLFLSNPDPAGTSERQDFLLSDEKAPKQISFVENGKYARGVKMRAVIGQSPQPWWWRVREWLECAAAGPLSRILLLRFLLFSSLLIFLE